MGLSAIFLIALTRGLNCTLLRLMRLLAYCHEIYFQIALKPMWLPTYKSSFSFVFGSFIQAQEI